MTGDTGDAEWTPDVVERGAVGQALVDSVLCIADPGGLVYTDAGGRPGSRHGGCLRPEVLLTMTR